MFLSFKGICLKNKQNLFKLVNNNLTRHKFKFRMNKNFSELGNRVNNSDPNTQDNITIDKFFSQKEQYILNFYKKHKENFLYQEAHDREFENFLNKMDFLISKESRLAREVNNYIQNIIKISSQGREPLREVLIYYQQFVTQFGFNTEVLTETLLHLGQVYQSRENFHRVYQDFSHWEFINSYRMYHIIEDLKFALTNDKAYLTADQISKCLKGLTLAGYKNTKLADLILEKVRCLLLQKKMNIVFEGSYAHTPGVGKSKFIESNPNAENIFYQKDFKKNVWKLLQIKIDEEQEGKISSSTHLEKSEEDIISHIKEIIGLLKETKEIQHNLTDTFDNLLDQYYKIEQALIENPELKYNQYIKFEVYKLQDKLVEAGYVSTETINSLTKRKLSQEEFEKMKLKNIISVLKDFALVNFPNLYNTGEQTLDKLLKKDTDYNLDDFEMKSSLYRMDDRSLGKILVALSEYSKITNVDINGEDYYNDKISKDFTENIINSLDKEHIKFKAEYTKLYLNVKTFMKEMESHVLEKVANTQDIAGLGYFYHAYVNMNISSCKELKSAILNRINELSKVKSISQSLNNEDIKHLIVGFTIGGEMNPQVKLTVENLLTNLNVNEIHKIEDMIKLLWGMSALNLYTNDNYIQILIKLSDNSESLLNFISNVRDSDILLYLYQLSVCMKYEAKDITIPSNLSFLLELYANLQNFYFLKSSLEMQSQTYSNFTNELLSDPIKDTILNGIKDGFLDKEIQRKTTEGLTALENSGLIEKLPFNPNFVFGFYGHKIALFVLGQDYSNDNFEDLNGVCKLAKRVLKQHFNTHAVFLQTTQFINFDYKTVVMEFKNQNVRNPSSSNLLDNLIADQVDIELEYQKLNQVNKYLHKFIKIFSNSDVGDLIFNTEPKENLEIFLNSLWQLFDLHSDIVYSYHPSLVERKIVDLKVALARNKSLFEIMTDNFKNYVNNILREMTGVEKISYEGFLDNLNKNYNLIKISSSTNITKKSESAISDEWVGKRLFVDLIRSDKIKSDIKNKDLSVELINNNLMWLGEFNSYNDWEEELKAVYDNFNYFVENSNNKFLFNSHPLGNRNVPKGIFPHPNKFRIIRKPAYEINHIEAKNDYELELKKYANYNEQILIEEVKKNETLSQLASQLLTDELSLKVNLLNIRNSLKQNLKDNQIIKYIAEFDFIDRLTQEHLNYFNSYNKDSKNKSETLFLSRNPRDFLNFYKRLSSVKGQYDEYDKFIMREYYNEQKIFELDPNLSPKERQAQIEENMRKKLDENVDNDALSIYNPNIIDYNYDIKSILSSDKVINIDSDLEKLDYINNPEFFLNTKRIQAERNLILLKIVSKLMNDHPLSENEKLYIKTLSAKAEKCKLNKVESLGLKNSVTNLSFADLSANDVYSLNTLYNVEVNEKLKKYSLSELILEFSHFVDNTTINKILHEMYGQLHLKEFDVLNQQNKNYSLFDVENKEPVLISNEIKEIIWRVSGFFNQEDKTKIKNMLRVKRGKSKFDNIWLELDEKSFEDFMNEANKYDDRVKYMEKWIKRKEKEIENRIYLPPDNLYLSDKKISKLIDNKDRVYRKTILSKIFEVDNINKIPAKKLNEFINEFISNLYLFNFNYPVVIKDIFNSLEDIPSIYEEDKQLLRHYRLFFKIDENNPFEFMAVDPIKFNSEKFFLDKEIKENGDIFDSKLLKRIENASIPIIPTIAEKLLNHK